MPTLNINGTQVNIDDGFLKLSPEDQNRSVDEIAKSLGHAPAGATSAAPAASGLPNIDDVMKTNDEWKRAKEGFGAAYDEPLGMSAETQQKYPLLSGFQPIAAGIDALKRLPGAVIGAGAGAVASAAEPMIGQGMADRLQTDLNAIPQSIAPEVPRAPSIVARRPGPLIAAREAAPAAREVPAVEPVQGPPSYPVQTPREGANVNLLPPETQHAIGNRSLSAGGAAGPLDGVSPGTVAHMRAVMEEQGFTPHTIDQRLEEMSPHQFLGELTPSLEADMGAVAAPPGPGKIEVVNSARQRAEEAPDRVRAMFDNAFGAEHDLPQINRVIEAEKQAASSPLYQKFLGTEIGPTPEIDALIPRLQAAGALQAANKSLAIEGLPSSWGFPVEGAEHAQNVADVRAKYGAHVADIYDKSNKPLPQIGGRGPEWQNTAPNVPSSASTPSGAQSLTQFIASKGGLGPDAELEAIGAHTHTVNVDGAGRRKLVRQGGWPLDYAREAAEEAGYLRPGSTPNDLLDAIDGEMRGQKLYPAGHEGTLGKRDASLLSERDQYEQDAHFRGLEDNLSAAGHGELGSDVKQRAMRLMSEGMDADTAVEHAMGQLEQEDNAAHGGGFPGDRPAPAAPTVVEKRVPTAGAFQAASEYLSGQVEKAITNKDMGAARRYGQLRSVLQSAIDNHPQVGNLWRSARETYAGPAKVQSALALGKRVLTQHIEPDELPFLTAAYGEKQMRALRTGIRSHMELMVGRKDNLTAETINTILSPNNIQKMRWALGDQATTRLIRGMQAEREMHGAPNRLFGGSPTALRLEAQKRWTVQPGMLDKVKTSDAIGAISSPVKTMVKVAETLGLNRAKAAKEAAMATRREEAARLFTLQGPERDAVARHLVNGGGAPFSLAGPR